eukprot:scaffold820_cov104-Isochrysis_galbana.AAC.3
MASWPWIWSRNWSGHRSSCGTTPRLRSRKEHLTSSKPTSPAEAGGCDGVARDALVQPDRARLHLRPEGGGGVAPEHRLGPAQLACQHGGARSVPPFVLGGRELGGSHLEGRADGEPLGLIGALVQRRSVPLGRAPVGVVDHSVVLAWK